MQQSIIKSVDTSSAEILRKTIGGLSSGENYTIYVYGITRGGIVSQDAAVLDITVKPEITIDLLEDSRTDTDSVFVVYTNETGGGLFDRYIFSIDDQRSTTVIKEKDDERMVKFESLVAGTLYTVTARSESGDERSRGITTQVLTVPRHPTLTCLVEETAITIHLTQDGGGADTFNLACTDCTDTMRHEGLFSLRFTNLVPFSTYTFSATTLAGSQPGNRKESEATERKCTASVGRKLLLHNKPSFDRDNITINVMDPAKEFFTQNITELKRGYYYTFVIHAYNTMKGPAYVVHFTVPSPPPTTLKPHDKPTSKEPVSMPETGVERNHVMTVVPVLLTSFVVIVIAILVVIFLKRRGCFSSAVSRDDSMDRVGNSTKKKTATNSRHHCNLRDFPGRWNRKSAKSFTTEFQSLESVGRDQATKVAELDVNGPKNRSTSILPYDNTRIKLMTAESRKGTDYLNGSWMPGFKMDREYAVVQGPLPTTRNEFWRMVWEQNAQAIVMLTKCVDSGKDLCDRYWPEATEPMYYGYLRVQALETTASADWVVSRFMLVKGNQGRTLTHFHYLAWPELGVPDDPVSLVDFVRLVRNSLDSQKGPLVVHCSTGAGRSGTFVAVDRLLQHIKSHDWVDVYNTVHEMLQHRCHAVQNEAQYKCIYQCLHHAVIVGPNA
ncbi:hypothetical protein LSAT2_028690 [Lamellibrachia satsuma]|nr:hypothetical protein LSAT2_028690 [Lamellibrachia satsuma]